MTTKRRSTMSMLALVAGLVGMVAFLAGPASADSHHGDGLTSGGAYAEGGSVASGSAVAINDSTASGDAVAIDGSVASGCSTAVDDSTASGADCRRDKHKVHHDGDHDGKVVHHDAAPARATSGAAALALTGSSSDTMVQMALVAFFAGLALVSLTNVFRRQTV